jgi:hypothetical protein
MPAQGDNNNVYDNFEMSQRVERLRELSSRACLQTSGASNPLENCMPYKGY